MTRRPEPLVLLVGEFGPGHLACSYERGFRSVGARVLRFDVAGRARAFGLPVNRLTRPLLAERINRHREEALFDAARRCRPDLTFVIKGGWLSARALGAMRAAVSSPIVNFYPDDPFSAPDVGPPLWNAFASYDRVYVFCRAWIPRLVAIRATPSYLPFAWDPEIHPLTQPQTAVCELSFVGNWWPDREAWLTVLENFDLGLWGHWKPLSRGSPLRRRVRGPAVYEAAMAELLSRSPITLNLIRIVANGHNMRSFEAPGVGTFLMSNRTPELTELFEEDREIVCFDTPGELIEKARFYLANAPARLRIAEAGHRRCEGQTYRERAARVFDDLGIEAAE